MRELKTIEFICEILESQNQIKRNINKLEEIYEFFNFLVNNQNSFNTLYIYSFLFNYINNEKNAKRTSNAKLFEDFLATVFKAQISDTQKRKNLTYTVPDYFKNTKDIIASNRREKADILFGDYKISVKTLLQKNYELNMGSFEKKVLFDDLGVNDFLNERKSNKIAGLGSATQLGYLFKQIQVFDKYNFFTEKLINMCSFIFAEDMLLAIKDNLKMHLYFIKGSDFLKVFKDNCNDISSLVKVINRWEGNSIRIDRRAIIDNCYKNLTLDFSILNNSILKQINEFDLYLHKNYARYFNEPNFKAKEEIIKKLDELFEYFNKNYPKVLK